MQNALYEAKPFVIIGVAILAIIQVKDEFSIFEISGYALLMVAFWILFARMKHRHQSKPNKENSIDG